MIDFVRKGVLEVYAGPMKSGKSKALMDKVDQVQYLDGINFLFFKPASDIRDFDVRHGDKRFAWKHISIPDKIPNNILYTVYEKEKKYSDKCQLVIIDEAQFFSEDICNVVEELLKNDKNVVIGGLDLNYRGEPFGMMGDLLAMADERPKTNRGVCQYNGCNSRASRTQRLVDGKPSHYNDSLQIIEGIDQNIVYEPRCLKHHFVPGKYD